ncbi:tetrapyrrole biosynthesis, uroporphyrinogen III synthase [Dendrothele bispora CBS 962.96]|uniref:Tetrapyrrole biosynthesis, uroporphyrinogen III synthase n=1 Tax=Dendrothele bispora (strain CBS 962.96) TaxID=1314807 RepID=A0A4S8M227_DENBC|nr:tetrapyrrole biosynthesis, uroporphyrinogen III synthase [Dendrothele bispora CBS 962.96]
MASNNNNNNNSFNPTNVLLLRAPDDPENPSSDKYLSAFANTRWNAVCVPVLETALVNLEELSEVMSELVREEDDQASQTTNNSSFDPYPEEENSTSSLNNDNENSNSNKIDGIIMTSSRACDAWSLVVDQLSSSASTPTPIQLPFYVIGTSTRNALLQIYFSHSSSPYSPDPSLILGADEAGNAEELARFIIRQQPRPRKLLYLTGDKNREVLPGMLGSEGIGLRKLQVYGTKGCLSFKDDLALTLDRWPHHHGRRHEEGEEGEGKEGEKEAAEEEGWWITFFAPSSASFVLPFLQSEKRVWNKNKRIVAIGKTTSAHLKEELGLEVDAVATKPSPEGLLDALQSAR